MKRYISAAMLILLIILPFAYADGDNINLFVNGDFSSVDADGMPEGWEAQMWDTTVGVSELYAENGAAVVRNMSANDARFAQTVAVEPDTNYRFSCDIMASGCGTNGHAATISFENTFVYSEDVYETNGQWRHVEIYVRTTDAQKELTAFLRVGGYGTECAGEARFRNAEAVRVDVLPDDVMVLPLDTPTPVQNDVPDVTSVTPKRNTEAYFLMACLFCVLILALARRKDRICASNVSAKAILICALSAALIVRIILAFRVRGYNTDIGCFMAWSERMAENGVGAFYSKDYFCDYPPLYMILLGGVSLIRRLFGIGMDSALHVALLKLIPILFDLGGGMIVYRYAKKKNVAEKAAALLAALYLLNPAAIIDSAAWGQIDSVFTLLIAICAIEATDDRYIPALIAFAAAVLVKPQSLLFAPLGLFAIAVNLIRARDAKNIRDAVIGVFAALGTIYLCAFICCVSKADGFADALTSPIQWIIELYSGTMVGYSYITVNALNLYELFNLNWMQTASVPGWTGFAWAMFALSYVFAGLLYARSRRRRLMLTGAALIYLIFCFGPMIHERYMFPAMLLLTLAYADDRDRRLLISLTAMTAIAAMNQILVLQGGMGTENLGHLQSSEQWLNGLLSLANVLNALFLAWTAFDICVKNRVRPLKREDAVFRIDAPDTSDHHMHINRVDCLLMAALTVAYSLVAFINLGSTKAPQTSWVSSATGEAIVFDMGDIRTYRPIYYGGICNSTFTVELSNDGETWTTPCTAKYNQGEIFRWIYYAPKQTGEGFTDAASESAPRTNYSDVNQPHPMQTSRYFRITAQQAGLTLSEFGFWGDGGALLPVAICAHTGADPERAGDPAALIDEQDTVPEAPSYYNSTYFDEIYHARTAYELKHHMIVYEWTHPPLGKVIMSLGIDLFGMTPFGWRFMGTLIGVLMLPLMYLLAKQLTKNTKLSFLAMALMALDSMHFTQTRIATIDSYAVFFIMLMYLFMFRYAQMDWKRVSLGRTLVPLGLCGVTMGVAWATKWIGLYASVGLALIFFMKLVSEIVRADNRRAMLRRALVTCVFCVAFFVVIPAATYYFSYYPHLRGENAKTFADMFTKKSFERVYRLQESMLSYHAGLGGDTHYYRSPWYQWPVIWWPMWYYSGTEFMPTGMISSISCMGNPAVWWSGLIALIAVLLYAAWNRRSAKAQLLVLIGFASQFLPWVLVPRSTFIYHYFASVPFIILCVALALGEIGRRNPRAARNTGIGLIAAALVLFIGFYPLESGTPTARAYAKYLRWFKWYNY